MNRRDFLCSSAAAALTAALPAPARLIKGELGTYQGFRLADLEGLESKANLIRPTIINGQPFYTMWIQPDYAKALSEPYFVHPTGFLDWSRRMTEKYEHGFVDH